MQRQAMRRRIRLAINALLVITCATLAILWVKSARSFDLISVASLSGDRTWSRTYTGFSYPGQVGVMVVSSSEDQGADQWQSSAWRWYANTIPADDGRTRRFWIMWLRRPGPRWQAAGFMFASVRSGGGSDSNPSVAQGQPWAAMAVVAVPHWFAALALALPPSLALARHVRRVARKRCGKCPECGYNLRYASAVCPECGATNHSANGNVADTARSSVDSDFDKALSSTAIVAGLAILLAGGLGGVVGAIGLLLLSNATTWFLVAIRRGARSGSYVTMLTCSPQFLLGAVTVDIGIVGKSAATTSVGVVVLICALIWYAKLRSPHPPFTRH